MSERTKMVATMLVEVSSDRVQQAFDHMKAFGTDKIMLMVFDGQCIGIDTESSVPERRLLPPPQLTVAKPKAAPARPVRYTLNNLTPAIILGVINQQGRPISTAEISENLGIPGKNIPLRQKVGRIIAALKMEGQIKTKEGTNNRYVIGEKYSPVRVVKPKKTKLTRKSITEDMVFEAIKAAGKPVLSKEISTTIGIPVGDVNVRSRVSEILHTLRDRGAIQVAGEFKLSATKYEVAAASATA